MNKMSLIRVYRRRLKEGDPETRDVDMMPETAVNGATI